MAVLRLDDVGERNRLRALHAVHLHDALLSGVLGRLRAVRRCQARSSTFWLFDNRSPLSSNAIKLASYRRVLTSISATPSSTRPWTSLRDVRSIRVSKDCKDCYPPELAAASSREARPLRPRPRASGRPHG